MHRFFVEYIPGFAHARLMDTYSEISRAYHQTFETSGFTEYDITEQEIRSGICKRTDAVVKILGHPVSGQNPDGWYIPLASMIPKTLDHKLVTGKPACRKIHYIASCALTGQAAGAAAAGISVWHAGVVGEDGECLLQTAEKYGINTSMVQRIAGKKSGHALILLESSGQNSIIVYRGANAMIDGKYICRVLENAESDDLVLLQNEAGGTPLATAEAKRKGLKVAWNPPPFQEAYVAEILPNIDFLFVNESEAGRLTGEKNPWKMLKSICENGLS